MAEICYNIAMRKKHKRIGEILIEKGLITKKQLKSALKIQKKAGGLLGQIHFKCGDINEGALAEALNKQQHYVCMPKIRPPLPLKLRILITTASLLLCVFSLFYINYLPFLKNLDRKIYSGLLNLEYILNGPPAAIKDIVIVGIDNTTVTTMPYRWPYPRSDIATVVENLKKAGPRVIGVDLAYFGKSEQKDDELLKQAFNSDKVVLASVINEYGYLSIPSGFSKEGGATYGITTKLQDEDGVIRRNLIYLINKKKKQDAFLSWEMQVLKALRKIDTESIAEQDHRVSFYSQAGEKWDIPVDPVSKTFLIHFRAHTKDFRNISFCHVLKGNYNIDLIKNKIVLIGVLPALFQDIHNTAFGFLPGVILNANAFLNLYRHDFLIRLPKAIRTIAVIIGVFLASVFLLSFSTPKAVIMILLEIFLFFGLSYCLLVFGYTWNYAAFVYIVIICAFLVKALLNIKFLDLTIKR